VTDRLAGVFIAATRQNAPYSTDRDFAYSLGMSFLSMERKLLGDVFEVV